MQVNWENRENTMYIYLNGELDHHAAHVVLKQIGEAIDADLPMRCLVNFSGVAFMDSSGIAVILGINRRVTAYGGKLNVTNIPKQASRVLHAAGIDKLVPMVIEG